MVDGVRIQVKTKWDKSSTKLIPIVFNQQYTAIPATYTMKNKCGMVFDSDSFDVGIDSMALACKLCQKWLLSEHEEVPQQHCGISGGLTDER